jgi:phosphate transport system substrate-binding protein
VNAIAALALALLAAAPATVGTPAAPTLTVKGSDTIGGELGPALARAFEAASPGLTVRWEGLGSATAFPALLDGTADLGASSRSVNAEELARAREAGVELREFVLGYDGIAVIVHPSNPIRSLSVEQLAALFSGNVRSWRELGGPELRPTPYGRPAYSGTHAFFKDKVLRRGVRTGTEEFAPDTRVVEHSEALLAAVARDPSAIGYVGMGWVRPGVVAALAVAPRVDAAPVRPALETVRSGSYPLYRPLLLYTRGEPQGDLRRFLQFILAGEGRKLVSAHDFITADVPELVQRRPMTDGGAPAAPVRVHRIHFAAGRATLGPAAEPVLELVAAEAVATHARLRVVGHTDGQGRSADNRRLARARAEAVAAALVRRGLRKEALVVDVPATDAPLATNDTPEGRRTNRRVDVEILSGR